MAFEKTVPNWEAAGTEPPSSLKTSGFTAGYKPPAAYFNWFWHAVSECLTELQEKVGGTVVDSSHDLNDYTSVGVYTYSAGSAATIGNVPEQSVQGTLVVLPRLLVDDNTNVIQLVITGTDNIYVRNKYDGTWNEWVGFASVSALNNHGRHVPNTCTTIEDWNNAVQTGWYMGNNATNAPTNVDSGGTMWYFGYVIAHNSNYVLQEVYQFTASNDAKSIAKYIRACKEGSWGVWTKVTVQRDVPVDAKLDYLKTLTGDAQTQIDNKLDAKPSFIEFLTTEAMDHGGYLDFHYNGSTEDWTSRIIEAAEGFLNLIADKVRVRGILEIADGDAGLYGDDHTVNVVTKSDVANDYKRSIQLMNKAYEADIADALILIDKDSSGSRNYKLYGEHNPLYTYGTTDLTAGSSALETGKLHFVYE